MNISVNSGYLSSLKAFNPYPLRGVADTPFHIQGDEI